jgi:hypothetical protein
VRRIGYQLDEHIADAVAEALARRGIDATTTSRAGLLGATDDQHLAAARAAGPPSSHLPRPHPVPRCLLPRDSPDPSPRRP